MQVRESGLSKYIDAYLLHLKVERNLAHNTLLSYERDLRSFAQFATGISRDCIHSIQEQDVSEWVQTLAEAGKKPSSQARMLVVVRGFFKWAYQQGIIHVLPTEQVPLPKISRSIPRPIGEPVVRQLLEASKERLRDTSLVALLYGAGLRVSEVVHLDIVDLRLDAEIIRVRGKGSKERILPVGEVVSYILRSYIERERGHHKYATSVDAVFPGRSAQGRLSRQAIFLLLRRLAEKAGLDMECVSPHKLRHGFATDLVRGGADLRAVQTMLGHADLRTTEIYTHVDDRHMRRVYDAAHPRK